MVPRKPARLIDQRDRATGWDRLAAGAWSFRGRKFQDPRGSSSELFDLTEAPSVIKDFAVAQENLVVTRAAGCARGLHYQIGRHGQEKLVAIVSGAAQFFWTSLDPADGPPPVVHSLVLRQGAGSLYTPAAVAHGFLALEPGTVFLMKMSAPVVEAARGEINPLTGGLDVPFAIPPAIELLSRRDREAPPWSGRRQ